MKLPNCLRSVVRRPSRAACRAPSLVRLLAMLAVVSLAAVPSQAQVTPPPPGTPPGQIQQMINGSGLRDLLRSRIASSGLSPDQVRSRLQQMGYDPSTLDPYLGSDTAPPNPTASHYAAIQALGITGIAMPPSSAAPTTPAITPPALPAPTREEVSQQLRVFGLSVFGRSTTQFQPLTTGPVPDSYVVGPGDQLILVLTGDVESSATLLVNREGFIVIPQVGQMWVNGLTLAALRQQMYARLSRFYSGIRQGQGATAHFLLSLGQLRTNQVFITGEVAQPGTYLVSPVASILNALYLAGGPTAVGSFRDVQVVRSGRVVQHVDLYDYLLAGNNLDSIRLDPGDVIFVPGHGDHVSVRGEVNRPSIYELKRGENLFQLLRLAGGTTTPASLRRARIVRILPPSERRTPGVDRVTLDVSLGDVLRDSTHAPALRAGDDVSVFALQGGVRNTVSLNGAVWLPGDYEFRPGMKVWDLIALANGLAPNAYRARAHIERLSLRDSTLTMIPVALDTLPDGRPRENPELVEADAVTVYDASSTTPSFQVTINGEVHAPRTENYHAGLTLRDLIVQAGGLSPTADLTVEVARLADPADWAGGHLAQLLHVRVDSTYIVPGEGARFYLGPRDSLAGPPGGDAARDFPLRPFDQVTVRRLPQFELPRVVTITGQVRYPGLYALESRDDHLRDFIERRAQGLLPTAYAPGFKFVRGGHQVNVDLPAVLRDARHQDNIVLMPGDVLTVPEYNPIVVVDGAVLTPTSVLYQPGASLSYYIENAGGYALNADRSRVAVRYANGTAKVKKHFLLFFHSDPTPGPGSSITVAAIPPNQPTTDWVALFGGVAQILASALTVMLVVQRL